MADIFVSVIVPTYNDWTRLQLCIEALSQQTFPKALFEVLIVNNNPDDAMPANLVLPENFKLLTEAKPGSYAARNAALKKAQGTIIAFTDSDCIPEKDWIQHAVAYLAMHRDCSRIGGRVSIFLNTPYATTSEKYDAIYAFPQQQYVARGCSSVTANLFTYKKVFDAVGLFNETLLSNGDLEWGRKAHEAGFAVHYVENVVVQHPARNLKELIRKEKRVGGGRGMAERHWNNKLSNLFRLVNGFRPRLAEIKYLYTHARHLPAIDKIKVLLLRHYLLNVRAFEQVRVQLGKEPNRI